jgi:hypothetical protein
MIKLMVLVKRKVGTTRESFIDYYEKHHAEFGKKICGHLWERYVRNYPQDIMNYALEDNSLDDSYDAITEIWLKDEAAVAEMERILKTPEIQKAVLEDEERFQDRLKTRMMAVKSCDTGTRI